MRVLYPPFSIPAITQYQLQFPDFQWMLPIYYFLLRLPSRLFKLPVSPPLLFPPVVLDLRTPLLSPIYSGVALSALLTLLCLTAVCSFLLSSFPLALAFRGCISY